MASNNPDNENSSRAGNGLSELAKRILSGLVMAAVSLALTVWSPLSFLALLAIAALVMCWEWTGMLGAQRPGGPSSTAMGVLSLAVLLALLLLWWSYPVAAVSVLALGGVALAWLAVPENRTLALMGPFYIGLPVLGLFWLRNDTPNGLWAILFVFLVVWMADIFAYMFGRTIGGPKLMPSISPNKTWSGALGGLLGSGLVGFGMAQHLGNTSWILLGLIAIFLSVGAQIGDFFESHIKRRSGIKDSSNLIPGHGGILDRVDGLIVASILAALIALFVNPAAPSRAILIW